MRSTDPAPPDEKIIPDETADADALRPLTDWSALPELGVGRFVQRSSSDRGQPNAAEEALVPLVANGNRDMNNFVCKSADADVGAPELAPYRYDLASCPDAYVRGVVLSRYEGSGRLVRLWMTVSSLVEDGGGLASEMLRIYVDDNPRPFLQAKLADVLDGSAGEIFAPPFGAGSSTTIAWYYPVVFGKKLVIAIDRLSSNYYFQTDVVLDPEPKQRFAPLVRSADRDLAITQLSAASPAADSDSLASEQFSVSRDMPHTRTLTGPATIRELRLRVASDELASLAAVRVVVHWDSAPESAIDLPLLDLVAARRAVVAKSNLALAAATDGGDRVLSLRLPMPFNASAEWTLSQTGDGTATFRIEWLGVRQVPAAPFGYLHVQENVTPQPATQLEQTIAQASGRGRYVGLCLDVEGRSDDRAGWLGDPLNFLEGDFRATVDGQLALDGTGAEDYPDSAFYFHETPEATPFAQSWAVIDDTSKSPPGGASFCRWHVLGNAIDFQSELHATHEIALSDLSTVDLHRSVAYLYLP